MTRLVRALLTVNDYIHEDPGRLDTMANIAAFAINKMGNAELVRTLVSLRPPTGSGQSGTNRSEPADP